MTTSPRLSRAAGAACGALAALYLLTGRWSFSRLDGETVAPPFYTELRFWVVLLLAGASLLTQAAPLARVRTCGRFALLALFALLYYLVASAFWAPDPDLASTKAYEMVLVAVATLGIARALSGTESERVGTWLWAGILSTAGVLAALALERLVALGATGERLSVLGGGPNTFARMMGYLAVAALFFWARRGLSWAFMPVVSLALLLVLLSGSRGGLLALVVAVAVFVAISARRTGRLLAGSLVAAGVFTLAATYTAVGRAAVRTYEQRIEQQLLQEHYTAGRTERFRAAYDLAMREPMFGDGLGGFRARGLGVYPHNLFLEAFCEAGLVALVLLAMALAAGAVSALRPGRDAAALSAFVLVLVASQLSGDLYDSRGVFAFLVAAILRPDGASAADAEEVAASPEEGRRRRESVLPITSGDRP